jgi:alginate O-acetyltransferase complex protein AlgI
LVAGPIERPQHLLRQFYEKHEFDYQRVTDGLKLMTWGFFKKVVLADRLAIFVNQVYNNPTNYQGISLIVATVLFIYQIYCDFSGYSDIALGSATVMGFRLMKNFDNPFHSRSISEFWKKWHISLTSWFLDYVYFPLAQKSRNSLFKRSFYLLFTFVLSGLWHGANWTFMIWGGINGIYLIFGNLTKNWRKKLADIIGLARFPKFQNITKVIVTFTLVCISGVFFRAANPREAFYIISHLHQGIRGYILNNIYHINSVGISDVLNPFLVKQPISEFIVVILAICCLEWVQVKQKQKSFRSILFEKPIWFRWTAYYALVIVILLLGVFENRQFIYFQF